ncbi:MAG TPA: hypothetical protein VNO21_17125 [Polyangiaceae bacterium]|nr:hypothetical protein [Polyangiaceae bacterium]
MRRVLSFRLLPLQLALCAVLFLVGASKEAHAQVTGITVSPTITRTPDTDHGTLKTTDVTRADCDNNITLGFNLVFTGAVSSSFQLQVWAGSNCADVASRQSATATCWPVAAGTNSVTQTQSVNVTIQDLVANEIANPKGVTFPVGTRNTCADVANANLGAQAINIYFLYVNPADLSVQSSGGPVAFSVAMSGPPSPTGVNVGEGDRVILVGWTLPTGTSNLTGINMYCAPASTVHSVTDAGADADTDSGTDSGPVDAGFHLECEDGGFTDGGFDDSGDATAGQSIDGGCTLVPNDAGGGTPPPADVCPTPDISQLQVCGNAAGQTATQGTIKNLNNGVQYVVGVASYDKYGNIGTLSNTACATPGPVADFLHNYRGDGGEAGGCTLESAPVTGGALAAGLSTLGIAFIRRRRKGKRS